MKSNQSLSKREDNIKVYKQIVMNMDKRSQKDKQFLTELLMKWDSNPVQCVNQLYDHEEHGKVFRLISTQYYCWILAYHDLTKQNSFEFVKKFNLQEQLLKLQQKISFQVTSKYTLSEAIHNSFKAQIAIATGSFFSKEEDHKKKNTELLKQWAEIKKKKMEEKSKKIQENDEKNKKKVSEKVISNDQKKKDEEDNERRRRDKEFNEEKKKKIKELNDKNYRHRVSNMNRYLESRKEFNFLNKDDIVRELQEKMMTYMGEKVKKLILAAKLKHLSLQGLDAGDQFRYYSQKNQNLFTNQKSLEQLPVAEQKILKLRYPNKLDQYMRLRSEEESKEEAYLESMKSKYQIDKKSGIVQNYVLTDQRQERPNQYDYNQPMHKSSRLTIHPETARYVVELDPWFNDQQVFQRTFYKPK